MKKYRNLFQRMVSVFWLTIGLYVCISSYRLGFGSFHEPGPGFIFFLAALLLIILSSIDVGVALIGKGEKKKTDEPVWVDVRWSKVLLVIIGLTIYIFIFNFLGFILSTFLLMIFLFKAVEPTKWWISVLSSLITILISYAIFNAWLKVPFPQGILGF